MPDSVPVSENHVMPLSGNCGAKGPYLERGKGGGHGLGKSIAQTLDEISDMFALLWYALDIPSGLIRPAEQTPTLLCSLRMVITLPSMARTHVDAARLRRLTVLSSGSLPLDWG